MMFFGGVISIVLAATIAGAQQRQDGFAGKFQQRVFAIVGQDKALAETSYGMLVLRKDTGEISREEYVAPDNIIYPASSIKTLVAVAILRKVDEGALALTDSVVIDQPNAAAECPEWDCAHYGPGKHMRIGQLLWDMITISNNLATNQLIDVAGKDFINETADKLQAPSLRVYRKVYATVDPEPDITRRNTASAAGMAQLYREIATGRIKVLSEQSRSLMVGVLGNQKINDRLNALFPRGVRFYHKTGSTSFSSSDAGFYYRGDNEVVILVGLQNFRNFEFLCRIGRAAYVLAQETEGACANADFDTQACRGRQP